MPRQKGTPASERVERIMFVLVVGVMPLVALLVFFFSFGNVGLLGVSLGVDHSIAFLTGPAIDLTVAGLVLAGSFLSSRGWTERQLWPVHLMAALCGLGMIALNDGTAVYEHRWRLAAFDTVGPALLIGWCAIGPWLLRQLVAARRVALATPDALCAPGGTPKPGRETAPTVPAPAPGAPLPLPGAPATPATDAAPAPRPATATADTAGRARAQGAPTPAAVARPAPASSNERMSTPTDRQRKIRRLILEHGRDNVDGAMVGKALNVHRSNGRLALKQFLQALDEGQISLDEDADESDRELMAA